MLYCSYVLLSVRAPNYKSGVYRAIIITVRKESHGPVDETAKERNEAGNRFTIPNTIRDNREIVSRERVTDDRFRND